MLGVYCWAVSMPHAALWVVQQNSDRKRKHRRNGFNAARGFVGGAAAQVDRFHRSRTGFNAARGFVGGAATKTAINNRLRALFQCRTRL